MAICSKFQFHDKASNTETIDLDMAMNLANKFNI